MPAGTGGKKKPFSGKQKRLQLQAKRDAKQQGIDNDGTGSPRRFNPVLKDGTTGSGGPGSSRFTSGTSSRRSQQQRNELTTTLEDANSVGSKFFEIRQLTTKADAGKYALMFRKETKEEISRQKKQAMKVIQPVLEEYLECKTEDFFSAELDIPIRPKWSYDVSREQLERNEYKYFHEYLRKIDEKFERTDLSYFELNLETWRQLWRVLEMSDIVLCVVDIRFPPLLFPPKLYDHVTTELGKKIILVLNKIDLCPAPLVLAWKDYFKTRYPELHVLCFTSYPSYNVCGDNDSATSLHGRRRKGKMRMAAEGALELYKACEGMVQGEVDLSSWKAKIMEEMNVPADGDDDEIQIEKIVTEKVDASFYDFKKFNSGILTIGCVGQPNVGKSSLINALMGRKVVSVSRTPGHTKHFQTIFLTPKVRLCDCPGLIFPSKIPKSLQVLCGSYPIAQLRDPYSTVKYLAERLDLPKILRISHPEGESQWCACDIADGWAAKRGYLTAKAARLDTYRGANQILRLALEGRICLCLYPPGYHSTKEHWSQDPRVPEILSIQAKSQKLPLTVEEVDLSEVDDDSDENADAGNDDNVEEIQDADDEDGSYDKDSCDQQLSSTSKSLGATAKVSKGSSSKVTVKNKFALLLDSDDEEEND